MANFLRDQQITNITINEYKIRQISTLFINRAQYFNTAIPGNSEPAKKALLYFTIRFDGKGYRVYNLDELLSYFQQAKEVERIIFTIETGESLLSNRKVGAVVELGLDHKNPNACFLTVTSDDKDMVDASFAAIQDVLSKCKNKNGWVRTAWTELLIQIIGVSFGFFISLWGALKFSSKLAIQNSFVICFLFILLIFSNTWSYLNRLIHELLNGYFPNLDFHRYDKDRVNWLIQAVITALIGAFALWILGLLYFYFINILSSFVKS